MPEPKPEHVDTAAGEELGAVGTSAEYDAASEAAGSAEQTDTASTATHQRPPLPTGRDIARAFLRPSRGQVAVGLLCLVLGFGGVLQVRAQQGSQAYAGARRDDLVTLLDSLNTERERLGSEQSQLEAQKQELQTGADKEKTATDAANQRIQTLAILAGTAPAQGPGIRLVLGDPQGKVTPAMLLDAIEELRDAGAEAIELNDQVRVVASTAFAPADGGIAVDGHVLSFPLTIEAIGDPATLEGGARFRGGIVSQVQAPTVGGTATVEQSNTITIASVVAPPRYKYAKPAK